MSDTALRPLQSVRFRLSIVDATKLSVLEEKMSENNVLLVVALALSQLGDREMTNLSPYFTNHQ